MSVSNYFNNELLSALQTRPVRSISTQSWESNAGRYLSPLDRKVVRIVDRNNLGCVC